MTVNSDKAVAALQAKISAIIDPFCIGKDTLTAGSITIPADPDVLVPFSFTYGGTTYSSANTVAWSQFLALLAGTTIPATATTITCKQVSTSADCSANADTCNITGPCITPLVVHGDDGTFLTNPTGITGNPCVFSADGVAIFVAEAVFNL